MKFFYFKIKIGKGKKTEQEGNRHRVSLFYFATKKKMEKSEKQ